MHFDMHFGARGRDRLFCPSKRYVKICKCFECYRTARRKRQECTVERQSKSRELVSEKVL